MGFVGLKVKIQTIVTVFALAFLFNLLWENFHARFYFHYQGNVITELILVKASLFDAAFITTLYVVLSPLSSKLRLLFIIFICLVFAIALERYALATGRWAYNSLMPIIPILRSGLTPTIQLALLGLVAVFLTEKFYAKSS